MGNFKNFKQTKILLPLEYCSPQRACRLFDIEMSDLFHFAQINVIRMVVHFKKRTSSDSFFDEAGSSPHWKTLINLGSDFNDSLIRRHKRDFSKWASAERCTIPDPDYDISKQSVFLNGYWVVDSPYLALDEMRIKVAIKDSEVCLYPFQDDTPDFYVMTENPEEISCEELLIMGPDLKRLHEIVNTGDLPVQRFDHFSEFRNRAHADSSLAKVGRDSKASMALIKNLLRLLPDTKDIVDNPTTCFNVLEYLFAKNGIKYSVPKSTFEDWMRKAALYENSRNQRLMKD